ncbi:MAG TPA: YebC/PmpR family DNA-binding transcriptional regulator [Blastocatellia bacterium]|nr:YebC/PmpR family DNA-binding transcriptional regulator [Blastocatellia bacterium]
MSGHSKWHTIKHKKGAADAKRGKMFEKLAKEIAVAARIGGGDPDSNARLRKSIADARAQSMPNEKIENAVKRGTGEIEGVSYEELTYEGYGPGGVAVYLECQTDNKNRTVAELRHMFSKLGGNLGESGCVSWMFAKKGYILVDKEARSQDEMEELAIEVGAEDIADDGDTWEIFTAVDDFDTVRDAIVAAGIEPQSAQIEWIPSTYVSLTGSDAQKMIKLMDQLEDQDDVQNIATNADISAEEFEKA